MSDPFIELRQVKKEYQKTNTETFLALKGVNLQIAKGEFVAIVGKSGSGKSTLLNMITGIDRPTTGEVIVNKAPIHTFSEGQMAIWRGKTIGIIFQFFQLLPTLSLLENIMLPMDFCHLYTPAQRVTRAMDLLKQVEMTEHADKLPSRISGGQQQRVAIARAMSTDAPLIVADEPTGNLDSKTADTVFALFGSLIHKGKTIIMVTHDDDLAMRCSRRVQIADGQIVSDKLHEKL